MRPIIPNTKNDLRKIHNAIVELTNIVTDIKTELGVVTKKESDSDKKIRTVGFAPKTVKPKRKYKKRKTK